MSRTCCGRDAPQTTATDGSQDEREAHAAQWWRVPDIQVAAVAGVLVTTGYTAGWAGAPESAVVAVKVVGLAVGGWTFVPSALRRLLRGRIGIDTLMSIAAVGALLLGEVGEAAMLAFLFSVAEGLEEYALARTRRGLRALLSLVPAQVTVWRGTGERRLPADQVRVGDRLLVRPGERVATDGIVAAGRTSVDHSAVTGESVPVEVGPGDAVHAGGINGTGAVEVEATAAVADNSLARVVRLVEAAQSRTGASQRLADRISRPLVPVVLVAAVAVAAIGSLSGDPMLWVERALVVLVAAAPCALALSVPVTVVAAVGAASRHGVLVKGGAALEALGLVRAVAFDKTGTLTRNHPTVVETATVEGVSRERLLAVAAALAARSEHPLAAAMLAAAGDDVTPAEEVEAVPGAGLTGSLAGQRVALGRPGWIDPAGLAPVVARMQAGGATVVLVEADRKPLGAIAVRDELRSEAAEMVAALRRRGVTVAMLSGDNRTTAGALALAAGIDRVHAELRPEEKGRLVSQLRHQQPTAMVGDGINDAPALAAADVGIAMGAIGADVAIETADVALMGEDLRHLPRAIDHARRARTIMWQNIVLSVGIIAALMPLALSGVLGLATVVLVHELAEVAVIGNGIRAGRSGAGFARDHTPGPVHGTAPVGVP